MKLDRSLVTAALLTASVAFPGAPARAAEIAKDTMVIVSEMGPNGLARRNWLMARCPTTPRS